jgi:hypothetical protein
MPKSLNPLLALAVLLVIVVVVESELEEVKSTTLLPNT